MMTRRHFEAMSRIIAVAKKHNGDPEYTRQYIRDQLAIMCQQENDSFDVGSFMQACEVTP